AIVEPQLVDLDHHPVDVVVELAAARAVALAVREGALGVAGHVHLARVDGRAVLGQPAQDARLRSGQAQAFAPGDLVEERSDASAFEARRLLALDHSGTTVARI